MQVRSVPSSRPRFRITTDRELLVTAVEDEVASSDSRNSIQEWDSLANAA